MKYKLQQGPNWGEYTLIEEYENEAFYSSDVQVGNIVIYCLTEQDVVEINRLRTTGVIIKERIDNNQWHTGAQAHIGNEATAGQEFPMIVVRTWSSNCVNGQVWLDGTDTLWKTSVTGSLMGQGNWYKP